MQPDLRKCRRSAQQQDKSKTLFHRLLVGLDRTSRWPTWLIFLIVISISVSVTLFWLLVTGQQSAAATAGGVFLTFVLIDAGILFSLPLLSISYGSWKSQLLVMIAPRTAVVFVASIGSWLASPVWGLLALLVLEAAGTAVLVWGSMFEVRHIRLNRIHIRTEKMEPSAKAFNLLHISDLHIERNTSREKKILQLVDEANPDLIVLTGDYLNLSYVHDAEAQREAVDLLGQLSAPLGVYAVLGGPTVDDRTVVPGLFTDHSVRLMHNEWKEISSREGGNIVLLGVDCSQNLPVDAGNLVDVLQKSPNGIPRILLYHTPDLMPLAAEMDVDLYLCGHTHGGQIRAPLYGAILTSSEFGKRYEMGLYEEANTVLYVSRGVGLEGMVAPRLRFLAPPEITQFIIEGIK